MNYMTPDQEGGRALSYCYQDKLVYALLADSFEVGHALFPIFRRADCINRAQESKKSALDGMPDSFL